MENAKKMECAKIFIKLEEKEKNKDNYFEFYVKKEQAETMYLFAEYLCYKNKIKYDMVGFGLVEANITENDLFDKKKLSDALASINNKENIIEEEVCL